MSEQTNPSRILHVDDDPDLAELVSVYLQREDKSFEVESSSSARDALDRLRATEFDCIISDYDMPSQNGIEFLKAVREDYPDLPFILYTGKGSEEIASEAISAGVTDYLQKGSGTDRYTVLANRVRNAVEQFRSQQALAERNHELRRYKQMINSMHEAACIYDSEGRFELVNEYLAEWYNETPEELEGDQSTLIPQIREHADGDPYQELLTGEQSEFRGELDSDFPGHGYAVLEYRLTPLRVDGSVEGVVGVARDTTDRKEQQQELHETKRRLELVLEGTETGIWEWNIDTGDIEWNDTVEQALGLAPGAFEGTFEAFTKRVHPDDHSRVEGALNQAIETDEQYHVEFRMIHENGDTVWVECPGVVIEQENESDLMVGLFRDITERKAREIKIQRQNDRLEQFASIVSHDLRNPLRVAEGRVELAKEECDSEHLDDVDHALTRMDNLIEDLLTLAREGDQVSDVEAIDLAELFEQCWRNVETADATLRTSVSRTIRANRSRLAQLLENLVRNAVEHGGEDVTITVSEMDDGFYVEDDGVGISEDERDDVFDAGYSTVEGGTGFGLSIVKQAADAHGWNIRVTEGSDGGARFEITGLDFAE